MPGSLRLPIVLFASVSAFAQSPSDLQQILDRLQRLEEQNRELMSEVKALRQELSVSREKPAVTPVEPSVAAAPLAERMEVQERRVEEQAQSKLESEHKFPVQLTGMVLFNAFWNGRNNGEAMFPVVASPTAGTALGGGTLRQSVLGLKFQGPSIFAGGKVSGSLYMDFYGGTGQALNQLLRLRIATLDFTWKRTTVSVAQDKPILSPREPTSLAQVGVSPLTAAGNLWIWEPQVRVEQRFSFGDTAGLNAQFGVFQTTESISGTPPEYASTNVHARPGIQGRFEFWKEFGGGQRVEIAPGFHTSQTLVAGLSLPSRVYSVDWLIRPFRRVDITGMFFGGQNTATVSGLRPGVTFFPNGDARTVFGLGGWAQLSIRATRRATFNLYGGQQSNSPSDLLPGAISRNFAYAGNVMYKLTGNVVASFEAYQVRTTYVGSGTRLVPQYDLALAYLF